MTIIDAKLLKEFRTDFKEAVSELEQKYNIVIEAKKISYSSDSFEMKVEAKITSGNKDDDQRRDFEKYCNRYGFSKEHYGTEFDLNGKKYRFIGFNPNNRKNFCVIESVNSSERYTCKPDLVVQYVDLQVSDKVINCEHCKNAILERGEYTGTKYIKCSLEPIEGLTFDELMWDALHPDEARKKYCKFCPGTPKDGGTTFDD